LTPIGAGSGPYFAPRLSVSQITCSLLLAASRAARASSMVVMRWNPNPWRPLAGSARPEQLGGRDRPLAQDAELRPAHVQQRAGHLARRPAAVDDGGQALDPRRPQGRQRRRA